MNGAMVRAILAGHKTQTRRVAKAVKHPDLGNVYAPGALVLESEPQHVIERACPFGRPGDRLWVRETWTNAWDEVRNQWTDPERYHYRADGIEIAHVEGMDRSPWIPSIHMPRRACRLVLEITEVRLERLQQISEADCLAEGVQQDEANGFDIEFGTHYSNSAVGCFASLWDSTGGNWKDNPWVWVVTFKRIEA